MLGKSEREIPTKFGTVIDEDTKIFWWKFKLQQTLNLLSCSDLWPISYMSKRKIYKFSKIILGLWTHFLHTKTWEIASAYLWQRLFNWPRWEDISLVWKFRNEILFCISYSRWISFCLCGEYFNAFKTFLVRKTFSNFKSSSLRMLKISGPSYAPIIQRGKQC